MAPTTRLDAGSIVVAVLVVLVGTGLVAGSAVAQETTDDGTSGNETTNEGTETMDDGMGENETMDDGGESMTEGETMDDDESMDDGTGTETMGDDSMTEEEQMGGDEQMDEGGDEQMDDETASGGQLGFGVLVAPGALVAAAAFVRYRRRG